MNSSCARATRASSASARADGDGGFLCRGDGGAARARRDVRIWTMPGEIEGAIPFDTIACMRAMTRRRRTPSGASSCRPTACSTFSARAFSANEPGAFLLGLVRSRGDALFRPRRAAAEIEQDAERRALGDAGGLLARMFEPRLLARQWRLRPRGVLCLCVSGAGRLRRRARAPAGAAYNADVGQFLIDYDAIRTAASPDDALLDFAQSTYEAAANRGGWDRTALQRSA